MTNAQETPPLNAPYLPPDGQALLIIGQDLGAIGGLDAYTDGYSDHIDMIPAGLTTYTSLLDLAGLQSTANWGSGDVNAQLLVEAPTYEHTVLAIGLWLGSDNLAGIAAGNADSQIETLGNWIAAQNRPVFVRIGYEFDGAHNAYDPADYIRVFRRIVDLWRKQCVTNIAIVWQSATMASGTYLNHDWLDWYPGDEYVDWFGLSYFEPDAQILNDFLDMAREHNKPVMIAEATPYGLPVNGPDGDSVWDEWFAPFFDFIHQNSDIIRAVAYINVDWDSQPMWNNQGWGNSRIQDNDVIMERWLAEIKSDFWVQSSSDLFDVLHELE